VLAYGDVNEMKLRGEYPLYLEEHPVWASRRTLMSRTSSKQSEQTKAPSKLKGLILKQSHILAIEMSVHMVAVEEKPIGGQMISASGSCLVTSSSGHYPAFAD
jgi:hypothetical protein